MTRKKSIRRRVGDIFAINLGDNSIGFGQVLNDPFMAFFDLKSDSIPDPERVVSSPVAFRICVVDDGIKSGEWRILGNLPLSEELSEEPLLFKKDSFTDKLTIYRDSTGEETPATRSECQHLECAAVWETHHVLDRLEDHFNGKRNKWYESMRP